MADSSFFVNLQEVQGGANAALAGLREAEERPGPGPRPTQVPAAPGAALGTHSYSCLLDISTLLYKFSCQLSS